MKTNKTIKNNNKKNKKIIIGLIYSNGCIHCQVMKPEWDKMILKLNKNIIPKEIEASENDRDEKIKKINKNIKIEYYPTLFKIKDNKIEYYKGGRTEEELLTWANGNKNEKKKINSGFFNFYGGKKNTRRIKSKSSKK
jgi:hypothetical protein